MRLPLSPLNGKPAIIWAISWFLAATAVTFSLWQPLFQWIPFSAYFAAIALIAARTGARMGMLAVAGSIGAMLCTGYFAPGEIVIRSSSVVVNSLLVIWLGAKLRQENRQSLEYQSGVNEAVSDFVWMMTPTFELIFLNKRGEDYLGLSTDDLRWDGWAQAIHEEDVTSIQNAFEKAVREQIPVGYEARLKRADGEYFWFYIRMAPVLDDQGQIVRMIGTSTNIEDRKRIEQEREMILQAERRALEESQRANRTKDEFLSTLSHELRTPLNAIMGWIYIVRNEHLSGPELEEAMEIVDRNARAQLRLIQDLLEMSRVITGKIRMQMENVDLTQVINRAMEAVQVTATAREITLRSSLDSLAGPIRGDADRLQQVMWNLLNNSIKFTPRGGTVEIALVRKEAEVEITVSDSGIGIEPGTLPYVFERFRQGDSSSTRNYEGLGLGLAIVKELVELQGGSVSAFSAGRDQGATFRVTLPLPSERPIENSPIQPSGTPQISLELLNPELALQDFRVLVVDDDEEARGMISRILQRHGANVSTASSAQEALESLSENQFHTLVSDIGMPVQDGCELIRNVRKQGQKIGGSIPAIALTAFARNEERVRAIQAGFDVYLAKPVDAVELIAVVERCAMRAKAQ